MRTITAALFALCLVDIATAQSWQAYVSRGDFFSVNFPDEPTITESSYASEYGATLPARIYAVRNGDSLHSVTVVDFTDAERIYRELPDRTDEANNSSLWLYDQRASVAFAARNFRLRGGEITYDAWHHIDLVEGHQLQITNDDGSRTYAAMYFNGDSRRLFVLEATVSPRSPPAGQFQQSLRFLDIEGERVRYRLSPNGCSVLPDA